MAYNTLNASSNPSNVGQKYAPKEDLARTVKLMLTPKGFQFDTQTLAETESEYQDAFEQLSDRCFMLPFIYENEDNSEEATKQDFTGGDSLNVRKGRYASRDKMHLSVSDMKKMASFNNREWRVIKIDANGNIQGTSPDDVVFQGVELTTFEVEKMNQTVGDVKRLVPIYYKEREPDEWTDRAVVLQPLKLSSGAWDPRDLEGLTDIAITQGVAIATKIIVTLTAHLKGVLLSGFDTEGDIIVKNAGVVQSITITDNNDGTYDLDGTGFANGFTVEMGASADLSQDGYEGIASITVTGI
jgi:hypothetical protein